MIDHFSIFTKSGIVLWSYNLAKLKGNPIDNLIRNVILEERGGENSYSFDQYTLKWNFANEVDLILVVVYQKILSLLYIEELLEAVKRKFTETFGDQVKNSSLEFDFTDAFIELLNSIENRSSKEREKKKTSGPKSFYDTEKGKQIKEKQQTTPKSSGTKKLEDSQDFDSSEDVQSDDQNTTDEESSTKTEEIGEDTVRRNIEKMKLRLSQKNKPKTPTAAPTASTSPSVKPKRGERKWDDVINNQEKQALDYSNKRSLDSSSSSNDEKVDVFATKIDLDTWQDDDPESDPEDTPTSQSSQQSQGPSMLQTLSGNKPLTSEDLAPLLLQFKDHLISKNVASDIALKLCDSVSISLEGKKLGTFGSVKTTIKNALEESLVRILTPKKSIDIIRDAQEAKEKGKVYTIVFCGVNGVGKSTNLAKTCAFLMQNGFTPMIAACDTFRSAAVEQLAVHCRRLGVELYEKGYRTDPAAIALEAVRQAKVKGKDVVLIDTTGRMQDNLPLMQALAKLVNSVKPDLVLFVGEALVGHDAVDQLVKFNQALVDLSKEKEPRKIDGIILTKFDTIDDKVGAAISMVYTTGQPIVFVGVGQHYTDLKRLNVTAVTKALLKGA